MNYCTNCGSKLDKKNNFCTNCGSKIMSVEEKKELRKKHEEKKNQNIILLLGIFLVLFSTFALGIISWQNMSEILRLSFFGFECVLFFVLSFVIKKLTDNKIYRVFFVTGLLLIPYTLSLIPYYGLLSDYYNKGPGLYIYLAIIYFITFIIYSVVNRGFKSVFVTFMSLLTLLVSIVFTVNIFINIYSLTVMTIILYTLVISLLAYVNKFSDSTKKVMTVFSSIVFVCSFILLLACFGGAFELNIIIFNSISMALYMLTGYIRIYRSNNSAFEGILPITLAILMICFINFLFREFDVAILYIYTIVSLILYFITLIFNKKAFNYVTLGITYFSLLIIIFICFAFDYSSVLLIISVITLLFSLFNIFISKFEWINYLVPINIYLIILSISKLTFDFKMIYVLIATALVFLFIYVILKMKNSKYSLTYLVTSYALAMVSMYNFYSGYDVINFGIILILLLIFVFSYMFKESEAISIVSFISLNFASLFVYNSTTHPLYYGLLTISSLTLIFSLLLNKLKRIDLKAYILYSEIVIFVITLFNSMHCSSLILFINIFVYALSYLSIIKFHNYKWWRIVYIFLGLLTITRVIGILIEPIVIASIISILVILIIIVIMYLLEIENNVSLTLLSMVVLYPYYNLVGNTFAYLTELYLIPFIAYIIVFTEIIHFKNEENKKGWTIVPLSFISLLFIFIGSGIGSIIVDVVLSLVFIILGLYRKYNYLIYFGVIFMVVTIFIRLFTILNSIIVVIMLIIIGFVLIAAALINEFRRKK